MLLLVAVMAVAVMGAEAKKTVAQLWREGGWTNYAEIIKAAESGAVEVKGQEWLVLLAKYETKAITAEQLWNQVTELDKKQFCYVRYWEVARRIVLEEPADSAIVKTVKAELEASAKLTDKKVESKWHSAVSTLGMIAWINHESEKAFELYSTAHVGHWVGVCGNEVLSKDPTKAADIYKKVSDEMLRGIVNGNAGKHLLTAFNKSAILANIPAPEVVATLTTIQRLYADRAVGDTPQAKEWGIFLGSLRDVIASWK